ncbi:MAG TPA: ISAzo13 family transposase, partial [Streptosporangiaceae bacterium]|nr:ISAzo13 family transposase [Streptosporangiaceae bacterium]
MGPQLELGLPLLDERARRLVLGMVARAAGDGGTGAVARLAGASWQTVADGAAELESGQVAPEGRVRRRGGGRKRLAEHDLGLVPALLALVEDSTRGDPVSPLVWTTRSLKNLSDELTAAGHRCSPQTAGRLLHGQGFSLQANAKTAEGKQHPDRDAQFRYIAGQAGELLAAGQPVISVDAKKKEQVGPYAQAGREWRPAGDPVAVRDHGFPDEDLGKVTPYGVYDVGANAGFVNVGTDHDTAAFAVESIRCWWNTLGKDRYPAARRLLVTADAGGSNSYRTGAWKTGLAALAAQTGLEITCCHFPPGTSKWNKIEHRLFSQISRNWRARPLTSHEVIVQTIAATTTTTGLAVTARLDTRGYPRGAKITLAQLRELHDAGALSPHGFHGDWNYTLHPAATRPAPPPPPPAPAAPPRRDQAAA